MLYKSCRLDECLIKLYFPFYQKAHSILEKNFNSQKWQHTNFKRFEDGSSGGIGDEGDGGAVVIMMTMVMVMMTGRRMDIIVLLGIGLILEF